MKTYKLKDLKKFIEAIEKKYGTKAANFKVEVHRPFTIEGEKGTYWAPHELETLAVAQYEGDRTKTVVIR